MDKRRLAQIATQYLVFDDGQGETQLIRRVQQAKGERPCFATGEVKTCNQTTCWWRAECLLKLTESDSQD